MDTLNVTAPTPLVHDIDAVRQTGNQQLLQLANILQTTLDIDALLKLFVHEVKPLLQFSSLSFFNPSLAVEFSAGTRARHSCQYTLNLPEQVLGDITLTRKKAFTNRELQELEQLLCILVYPLRNALLYRKALQEAKKDALTNLSNRAALDEALFREVKLAHRHNRSLTLLVVDIDRFKLMNDTFGHASGDCLIRALAEILQGAIRTSDMVFRYGGEEFVILLPNTDQQGALLLAERIRIAVEKTDCYCFGKHLSMTVSVGLTALKPGDSEKDVFLRADKALYEAKGSGRNCVRIA